MGVEEVLVQYSGSLTEALIGTITKLDFTEKKLNLAVFALVLCKEGLEASIQQSKDKDSEIADLKAKIEAKEIAFINLLESLKNSLAKD